MSQLFVKEIIFLKNLVILMRKWGMKEDDWFIEDGFFTIPVLNSFSVFDKNTHFHIRINKKAIPWELKSDKQILPPLDSQYLKDYLDFLQNNTEIILDTKEEDNFLKLLNNCKVIKIDDNIRINQIKPFVRLRRLLEIKEKKSRPELSPQRYLELIDKALEYAREKNNQEVVDFLNKLDEDRVSIEIKGETVNGLSANGRIKLLFTLDNNIEVDSEDILVAEKTYPRLLPTLIKVKGLIASQGGINSHAAITCRELNLPGIINIPKAFYLFRQDDYVEMKKDGTVKIIKPNLANYKL